MSYIYHIVPNPFVGTQLIPLNEMEKEGELYKKHAKKYIGRESLIEQNIPILNCLWNDVVQFSALNPQLIVDELKVLDPNFKLHRLEYFKIHVDQVAPHYDGVIFDRKNSEKKTFEIFDDEVQRFNNDNYIELEEVPVLTREFWIDAILNKRKVLWFPYITHIFLKGRVDTRDFEVCEIKV
jgi:hypothetical protein